MSKNVTIRLDDSIVMKCRHTAVEADKSFSIAGLMVNAVSAADVQRAAERTRVATAREGVCLGWDAFEPRRNLWQVARFSSTNILVCAHDRDAADKHQAPQGKGC